MGKGDGVAAKEDRAVEALLGAEAMAAEEARRDRAVVGGGTAGVTDGECVAMRTQQPTHRASARSRTASDSLATRVPNLNVCAACVVSFVAARVATG